MTSPSVVILTEPANCELADGQLLLQALVEAQELSSEGVPVSQAFCDNPAAAQGFIDAYARAYPELQLQSPDLPLPEQLYSMMVDGRLAPLPDLNLAPDGTKLESADKLSPLIVLSLGAPDGLMEGLRGNRSVNGTINVVEIAPVDQSQNTSVSVAAAGGIRAIADSSLSPDTSASSASHEVGEVAPTEALANELLELDNGESGLSGIQFEDEQAQRNQPEAAIVDTAPVIPAADPSSTQRVHADAPVGDSGNATSPASQPGPGLEPEAHSTVAPALVVMTPAPEPTVLTPVDPEPTILTLADPELTGMTPAAAEPIVAADGSSNQAETSPAEGVAPLNPSPGTGPETQPQSPGGGAGSPSSTPMGSGPGEDLPDAAQVSDDLGETAASLATSAADPDTIGPDEDDPAHDGSSFSDPGEDVLYPPTGSFISDDDVVYPALLAAAPDSDPFSAILRMSMADDIVDLEAISSAGADHAAMTTEPFDPILMRAGAPDGLSEHDFDGSPPQHADMGHVDRTTPDHDNQQDETITPVHDLDI
jgi:hypothetical protein